MTNVGDFMANLSNTLITNDLRVIGSVYGNTSTSDKFAIPRVSYISLDIASTASTFDWSSNAAIPVSGILSVGNGGTGLSTMTYKNAVLSGNTSSATGVARSIRTYSGALFASGTDEPASFSTLLIEQGGTSASSAEGARTNFGIYSKTEASNLINSRWPIFKKQSSDFTNWDQFTETGLYEIGGQPSGVFNSPESGRMTLYVIKSVDSGNNTYKISQLAIGNYVYQRVYLSENSTWSNWAIVNGEVTFALGSINASGNVSLADMKKVYVYTKKLSIVVGGTIGGIPSGSIYLLSDVVYGTGNEITAFHFSRPNPDTEGSVGEIVKFVLTSSGWSTSGLPVKYAISAANANRVQSVPRASNVPVATKTLQDGNGLTIYNNYATMRDNDRTIIAVSGTYKVYCHDGTLFTAGTWSESTLSSLLQIAESYQAINIHYIYTGTLASNSQTIFLRSNFSPESTYCDLAVGRPYNLTIQNASNTSLSISMQIGGRYSAMAYYDCWHVSHDGRDDSYVGFIEDNPFSHYHELATIQANKCKCWELLWYVVPGVQWNLACLAIATKQ